MSEQIKPCPAEKLHCSTTGPGMTSDEFNACRTCPNRAQSPAVRELVRRAKEVLEELRTSSADIALRDFYYAIAAVEREGTP